ncbi:NAD(P)-dependent oxidoreductase [Thermoflexibacter ruber]|uniref:Putative NADH-flavin reductase n=1 Tax=Thermoflexibacter ruber TaxID=1003 RepID=A0A1I2IFS7_9BACT|nr:NAD(P)H-binding protein [Thermoflexibacter ruber]SFF40513.1 Putative NADH-flavin reductase [Thermoflexibacter ruber]
MKKIILFGATGFVGSEILQQAIHRGFHVKTLVRNPAKLKMMHSLLETVLGDVSSLEQVERVLEEDALVVSALSANTIDERITYIENIIKAMNNKGLSRLIVLGGAGILQISETQKLYEGEHFPLELLRFTLGHLGVLAHLKKSGMDYTLVCPPQILPNPATHNYAVHENYAPKGWTINCGDLVHFIMEEVKNNKYIKSQVSISN